VVTRENGPTSRTSASHPTAGLVRSITKTNVNAEETSTNRAADPPANAFQNAKEVTCGVVPGKNALLIPIMLETAAPAKNGPDLSVNVSASPLIISTRQNPIVNSSIVTMMNNGARNGQSAGLSIAEDIRNGMTSWALANALRIGSGHVDKRSASQSTALTATSSTSNTSAVIRSLVLSGLLSQNRSRSQTSPLTRRISSERESDAGTTGLRPGFLSRQSVCATPLSKERNVREEESTTLLAAATHVLQIAHDQRAALEAKHGTGHQESVVVMEVGAEIGGKTFEK